MAQTFFPSVGQAVVRQVMVCDLFHRPPNPRLFISDGVPGHLFQLTIRGRAQYEVGGRQYVLKAGDLIWHHELETVKRRLFPKERWAFYTVNFLAPDLPPPPFERRVCRVDAAIKRQFARLLADWRKLTAPPIVRELRVQAAMLALLADVIAAPGHQSDALFQIDAEAELWWNLENRLRQNLAEPMNSARIVQLSGRSYATIARACHCAVGQPPMKRIRHLRLSLASSLVLRSKMRMKEISNYVGYTRQHEFCRDYHKAYGMAPREHRRHAGGTIPPPLAVPARRTTTG